MAACVAYLSLTPDRTAHADRRRAVAHPSPPLLIRSIDPTHGPIGGGSQVTIRGGGFFQTGLQVAIDGQLMPVTYIASDELRITTPPHDNGFVELRVVNRGLSASAEFLYEPPRIEDLPTGSITTVAGIGKYSGKGGLAHSAPFEPTDIAVDADGSVLIAERDRSVVRVVSPRGTIAIVAGRGFPSTPSELAAGDIGEGGPAIEAGVGAQGIALGPDGHVYLATIFQHRIRRVDRTTGVINTVAGSGSVIVGAFAGDNGPAVGARLDQPNQIGFDGSGNMYILDAINCRVRKVSRDGIITTVAGNGARGFSGDGGPATLATFDVGPNGDNGVLKVTPDGTIFLGDTENRRIRRIDAVTGRITTILGGGAHTDDGLPATQLQTAILGIAVAPDGAIYFSDQTRVRKIGSDGIVSTLFGGATPGFSNDGMTAGLLAGTGPLALDLPRNRILFIERSTNRVRAIDLTTRRLSTIAGIGPATFGENGPAIAAELDGTDGDARPLAFTPDGELLIGGFRRLRLLEANGVLRTIAGGGLVPNGPPPSPRPALGIPLDVRGIAVAGNRDIYVSDAFSIGRITPDGTYRRIAGGRYGYSGDSGPAIDAALDNPAGLAVDAQGNLFIADVWNHCIRRIDGTTGIITTFAGKSPPHAPNVLIQNPSTGDGGPAVDAQLNFPTSVAIDASGNVYVAEPFAIRVVDGSGRIDTVVPASRCNPRVVASDASGRIFAHCFNGEIIRIDGKDSIITIARTSGRFGFAGDGKHAADAETRDISGLAIDSLGSAYLLDVENRRVRAIRGVAQ